jgi:hypothetical protein
MMQLLIVNRHVARSLEHRDILSTIPWAVIVRARKWLVLHFLDEADTRIEGLLYDACPVDQLHKRDAMGIEYLSLDDTRKMFKYVARRMIRSRMCSLRPTAIGDGDHGVEWRAFRSRPGKTGIERVCSLGDL